MNYRILFFTILIIFTAVASYKVTHAFFTSNQIIVDNTITTASISPTPTISLTPTITPTPTPTGIANHVVISEVQIDGGPSNADKDFIELYNPTNSDFNLNGHRLVKRTGNGSSDTTIKSWTSTTLVPAHGFYLWANSSIPSYPSSIGADTSTSQDLTNSNSIALRNGPENTGSIVDSFSWNNGATIGEGSNASAPGDNQSLERKALSTSTASSMSISGADETKGNGFDSNDNSVDFVLRAISQPQNSSSGTETL